MEEVLLLKVFSLYCKFLGIGVLLDIKVINRILFLEVFIIIQDIKIFFLDGLRYESLGRLLSKSFASTLQVNV